MKLVSLVLTVLAIMQGIVKAERSRRSPAPLPASAPVTPRPPKPPVTPAPPTGMNNIYCHPSTTTWVEAYNICKGRNQVMVMPKTIQDLTMIVSICGGYPDRWYHTGARRQNSVPGDVFLYPDNSQVPSALWAPGEPNQKYEECTEIRPDRRMNDITCFNNYPVCMDRN